MILFSDKEKCKKILAESQNEAVFFLLRAIDICMNELSRNNWHGDREYRRFLIGNALKAARYEIKDLGLIL